MDFIKAIKILNLNEQYSPEELNKSFKNLSKKYHPDINKEPNSEEKYKEISEAYHFLKDYKPQNNINPKSAYAWYQQYINFDNFDFGVNFGNNKKYNETIFVNISFLESIKGCIKEIPYIKKTHDNQEKKLNIKLNIGPGVESNTSFIQIGAGSYNPEIRKYSNLEIKINIIPHPSLVRKGINIESSITISLLQALEGATVDIETIDGFEKLYIKPKVKNKDRVILKNKGINTSSVSGDHIITLNVDYPDNVESIIKVLKGNYDFSSNVSES